MQKYKTLISNQILPVCLQTQHYKYQVMVDFDRILEGGLVTVVIIIIILIQLIYTMYHLYMNKKIEYKSRLLNILYSHLAMILQASSITELFLILDDLKIIG